MLWLLLLFSIITGSLQQLQVEVTQENGGGVFATYTHPNGLSLDWWSVNYINIPQTGLTGVLLYQPVLCKTSAPLPRVPENCLNQNFSLILLTPHLLSCPELIVRYAKENGYSGVITYGDNRLTIENKVYDPSSESLVYLQPTNLLFAAVSETFATELRGVAVSACSHNSSKLTTVSRGSANVTGAKFGMSVLLLVCMLLGLCFIIALMNGMLKCCKRESGFYDVQNIQIREMEFSTPAEARARTQSTKLTKYDDSMKDINSTCPICLDAFSQGDDVWVSGCKGGHAFHPRCIGKWLASRYTCPLCRNQLRPY